MIGILIVLHEELLKRLSDAANAKNGTNFAIKQKKYMSLHESIKSWFIHQLEN